MAKEWKAFVEADCALGSIPGETVAEAKAYIKNNIDTGDLGPIKIKTIEEDE